MISETNTRETEVGSKICEKNQLTEQQIQNDNLESKLENLVTSLLDEPCQETVFKENLAKNEMDHEQPNQVENQSTDVKGDTTSDPSQICELEQNAQPEAENHQQESDNEHNSEGPAKQNLETIPLSDREHSDDDVPIKGAEPPLSQRPNQPFINSTQVRETSISASNFNVENLMDPPARPPSPGFQLIDDTENSEVFPTQTYDTNPHSQSTSRQESTRTRKVIKSGKENDISIAYDNLINNNEPPPPELYTDIIRVLNQDRMRAIMQEDYESAESYDALIDVARQANSDRLQYRRSLNKQQIEERLQRAIAARDKEAHHWDSFFANFHQEQGKQRQTIESRHQKERNDFEAEWGDIRKLVRYNKPSSSLLQMRKIRKSMVLTKQYGPARDMKVRIDQQTQLELENAELRAAEDMKMEYQTMEMNHKRELDCFNEHEKQSLLFFSREKAKVMQPLEMAVKQLEAQRDSDKPTNMKAPTLVHPKIKSRPASKLRSRGEGYTGVSQSTTQAFANYRKNDEAPSLGMKSLDVKRILGSRRIQTMPRKK